MDSTTVDHQSRGLEVPGIMDLDRISGLQLKRIKSFNIRSCSRGILITTENKSHRIIHLIKKLLQACTQGTKTSWINVFEQA